MASGDKLDFQKELADVLRIPGVKQNMIAEWAGVDASTVTRWVQGKSPSNPVEILGRLQQYVERHREEIAKVRKTEVDSWRSLYSDLNPGIRDYVDQTGLLAGLYYAVLCWIPSSESEHEFHVVALRYFDAVWADMGQRVVNMADQSQIVTLAAGEKIGFDQEEPLGTITEVTIGSDKKVIGKTFAQLCVRLNLDGFPYDNRSIGFVDGFGYRFRAKDAILAKRMGEQTNDFLGAPVIVPCRRLNMIVCIPRSCLRGFPSAMSYSNRGTMLMVLTRWDDANLASRQSLLWPRGREYALSTAPDSPMKELHRPASAIENMPHALQEALKQPADTDKPESLSIQDVLCHADSSCFLLDIHAPHPSLTNTIVWRLAD